MFVTQWYEPLNSYESLTTVTRHFVSGYWRLMTHLHTTARALNEHVGSTFREWLLYISASRVQFAIGLIVFQFKPSKRFYQYRLREGTGLHLATFRIKLKLNTSWGKTVILSDWSDSSVKIIYALLYFRSKVKRLWLCLELSTGFCLVALPQCDQQREEQSGLEPQDFTSWQGGRLHMWLFCRVTPTDTITAFSYIKKWSVFFWGVKYFLLSQFKVVIKTNLFFYTVMYIQV